MNSVSQSARFAVVFGVGLAGALGVVLWGPIPQDQAYHAFADSRTLWGIPNALDVLSNLPFLIAGAIGVHILRSKSVAMEHTGERRAWTVVFAGVALTSFGSAWYHLAPADSALAWDRLPMTIVFMAFFAAVLGERIAPKLGALALWPLVLAGLTSIVAWRITGDLRAYAVVQFAPLVMIVLLLALLPGRYDRARDLWMAAGWYAAAKVLEAADRPIFDALGGTVSGHTLKHLAAALAAATFALHVARRRHLPGTARGA